MLMVGLFALILFGVIVIVLDVVGLLFLEISFFIEDKWDDLKYFFKNTRRK